MVRNVWIDIAQGMLWCVTMAIVMGWLARSRAKQRPACEANTLRHPTSLLVTGVLGFVFFAGIALVSNSFGKNDTADIWTTLIFLFFAALFLAILADYFFARHRLSFEGINYGRMHGQRGFARWTELRSVKYSPAMKWFTLRSESGATIRISALLMGLPEFARHVLAHVPSERIAGPTLSLLREAAKGRLPQIWR